MYVSAEAAKILEDGLTVTIGEDGYTQWLSIPAELEGKTLTVSTEADGVFVYNPAMLCQYNRVTDGDQPVTLPAGGYLGWQAIRRQCLRLQFLINRMDRTS